MTRARVIDCDVTPHGAFRGRIGRKSSPLWESPRSYSCSIDAMADALAECLRREQPVYRACLGRLLPVLGDDWRSRRKEWS